MRLSKRLLKIIESIKENDQLIDIGADHGYVSIYLTQNNLAKKADASEIGIETMKQTRKNITKYNLQEKINLFLSDGLKDIDIKDYNKIIIAGMGAKKIVEILSFKPLTQELILNPTNGYNYLRKNLAKLNYEIIDEDIIYENRINNLILRAKKNPDKKDLLQEDIFLGPHLKNKLNQKEVFNFYSQLYNKYQKLYKLSKNNEYKNKAKILKKIVEKKDN